MRRILFLLCALLPFAVEAQGLKDESALNIEKFENHAVRWLFMFYKPGGEWKLNAFYWDDRIGALFD
jgi:hypothetical protein